MNRYEQFGANCIKDNNENARPSLLGVYQAVVVLNQQDENIKELQQESTNELAEHEEFTKKSVNEIQRLKDRIEDILALEDEIIYNCLILITDGIFENADREDIANKLNVRKEYIDYLMDYYSDDKYKNFDEYFDKTLKIKESKDE